MQKLTKEQFALEQLEAERERRREERVASGEAIRAPMLVVAAPESIDAERARRLSALRDAGEKREVYFGLPLSGEGGEPTGQVIEIVATGVPRAGRDDSYVPNLAPEPTINVQRYEKIVPLPEKPPAAPVSPPVCRRSIRVQTLPPTNRDPGAIAEGWYLVQDGVLHVEDMQGRLLGRQSLQPGDNAEAIARRILRDKSGGGNDFYKRLQYPPNSIH